MNEINVMGTPITTDTKGRFSLNDLHKAAGGDKKHQPANFLRLDQTKELISELTDENKLLTSEEFPVETIETIEGRTGGTFVTWELVYAYAMWVSPKFHLHVIRTFHNLQVEERKKLTHEIDAHKATISEVAHTATRLRERVDFLDSVVRREPVKKGDRMDIMCKAMDKGVREYRTVVVVPHIKKVGRAVKEVRSIVTRLTASGALKGYEREQIESRLCEIEDMNTDLITGIS